MASAKALITMQYAHTISETVAWKTQIVKAVVEIKEQDAFAMKVECPIVLTV